MSYIKTKTGENTITFDAFYQYIWARNYGDTDVYISNHSDIVAGDDIEDLQQQIADAEVCRQQVIAALQRYDPDYDPAEGECPADEIDK